MRYTGPSCRQCRREGTKLFLKGTKCFTEKCPVERRPFPPGQHGQNTSRRRKVSDLSLGFWVQVFGLGRQPKTQNPKPTRSRFPSRFATPST